MRGTPTATQMVVDPDTDPVIEAYKRDVDRTLIRENLKLSVEQRLKKLAALQQFAIELRRAGEAADRGESGRGTPEGF